MEIWTKIDWKKPCCNTCSIIGFSPFHLFNQKKLIFVPSRVLIWKKIHYLQVRNKESKPPFSSELENYLEYNTAEYKVLLAAKLFSNQKCSCANLSYFSILSWQMPLTFSCLCDYYMVDEVLKEDYLVSCSSPITN